MIDGGRYAGDDKELMKLQFDHYWDALRVLSRTVAKCYFNACTISGLPVPETGWPLAEGVDHRTIQTAHDIIAAAWRHHVSPPEPGYDFESDLSTECRDLWSWLNWLSAEIRTWALERPDLIVLFVCVLQNQNNEAGYQAEETLCGYLRGHYSHIEWL